MNILEEAGAERNLEGNSFVVAKTETEVVESHPRAPMTQVRSQLRQWKGVLAV